MKTCTYTTCKRILYAKGYCEAHYKRARANKPMDIGFRTTPRNAKVVGDIALIPLGIGAKDGYAIVDAKNSKLDKHKWSLSKRGYPVAFMDNTLTNIHHCVVGKPETGKVVDHINRDKLDNRVANLRIVTQQENTRNSGMFNTNTSGVRGVTYDKRTKKWIAQAFYDKKLVFGGRHETIKEAAQARKEIDEKHAITKGEKDNAINTSTDNRDTGNSKAQLPKTTTGTRR
jgi:hypothetical protein